ncbi:MAG: D-sedoheptulose 7-phosphate isomerase [Bacteroidetes bacterium]|nr:D-sedoheptulose 7-phosphate isomerase [Bacteroidota bacterium]
MPHTPFITQTIQESINLKQELLQQHDLINNINLISDKLCEVFNKGNRLLIAGNGGSAADAQHIAAEFVCRFNFERPALPAIALATNFSMITAAGNDYSFDDVFAREIQANGQSGDMFIGISTSGNSTNILKAIEVCKEKNIHTVGLSGSGGKVKNISDTCLCIPSLSTPRIQECHILVGHIICELVENQLFLKAST